MELVPARHLVRADNSANPSAIFRTHLIRLDGEVLDRLKRGVNVDCALAKVIVIVATIEQVSRAGFPSPSRRRVHIEARLHGRRCKRQRRENISIRQRCIKDGCAVNLSCEIGGRGLHQRNLGGHFHKLRGFCQFQLAINRNSLTCLDDDARNSDAAKVGSFNLEGVATGWHKRKAVGAVGPRCSRLGNVGADVGDGYCRARNYRASGIRNRAGDYALHGLRPSNSTRSKNQESRKQDKKSSLPHTTPPEFMKRI